MEMGAQVATGARVTHLNKDRDDYVCLIEFFSCCAFPRIAGVGIHRFICAQTYGHFCWGLSALACPFGDNPDVARGTGLKRGPTHPG